MGIRVDGLRRVFAARDGSATSVLEGLSFEAGAGEIVSVFGPNGCGKTTLLRLIAGLDRPDQGQVSVDQVTNRPRLAYVPQDYEVALQPWRSVLRNVAFPLECQGLARPEAAELAYAHLKRFGFEALADRRPMELSAGQQQQTAIAQATVHRPENLLLDEALTALDFKVRPAARRLLTEMVQAESMAVVVVTHDLDEALLIGSTIVVLGPAGSPVRGVVTIPRSSTRDERVVSSDDFLRLRQRVLALIVGAA